MTRISVSLPDPVAEAVKAAAGGDGKVSGWIANLVSQRLLADAAAAAGRYDADHSNAAVDDWEADRLAGRA